MYEVYDKHMFLICICELRHAESKSLIEDCRVNMRHLGFSLRNFFFEIISRKYKNLLINRVKEKHFTSLI